MITKENFKQVLETLGFAENNGIYTRKYNNVDCELKVDFKNEKLIFPTEKGFQVNDETTSNFSHPENFVVFECVARLFEKGYRPEHIELEPRWSLGHGGKSGKADICVKNKDDSPYLCIIECKTADSEYKKEKQNMIADGGQLFSYWQQVRATKWLVLYASDFSNNKISYTTATVNCSDDANFIELAKDDKSLKLYKDAKTVEELFEVWKETYEQKFLGDLIFDEETVAYDIGVLPLKKKRLIDFSRDDKIVNQFEEILRHNNVSDKENAFNRLIALFIAKLYDEKTKSDENIVDFQYKSGTDTYQKMQDRLQHLHHLGMKEFMKEEVFYVADDYIKNVMKNAIGENREQLENELNETITKLKFYTNNDFAFKDVHNKALFYQNGKILVEMVELFQQYRIIDSNELQLLGDMFEQLLNKGFKQNEGQFFTPVPITSFIWKCLPLESIVQNNEKNEVKYPKIIDYACGAGHFLTEGFREINNVIKKLGLQEEKGWERDCIYGIEKDYRLARVSKISLFMHGADEGNIIFGDGLDNHSEGTVIKNGEFDILVANPPYSVSAFKNHLELKNNKLDLFDYISKDGKEIETLFVERIAQLLKPNGIAAVVLPSSVLSNSSTSYIKAREVLLKNFELKSIVQFGSKTFGATGTNTVVLYLKKNGEPPVKSKMIYDNVSAIFTNENLRVISDQEIFENYCNHIKVPKEDYIQFLKDSRENNTYEKYGENKNYFSMYVSDFEQNSEYKNAQKQDEKQKTNLNTIKAFYNYVLELEKDKVYYFALVYNQKVLVVTSPSDNSEQEKFLGYTWSNRKGDEGIKLKEDSKIKCGVLYNTNDEENSLACYVKDSFLGIYRNEGTLQKYINSFSLFDMLDFTRTSFDKAIRTNVQTEKSKIESKWKFQKIEEITSIIESGSRPVGGAVSEGILSLGGEHIDNSSGYLNLKEPKFITEEHFNKSTKGKIKKNDLLICKDGALTGKVALVRDELNGQKAMVNEHLFIVRCDKIETQKYLFNFFFLSFGQLLLKENITGSAQGGLNSTNLKNIKIPLPPLDIQQKIVDECEVVDSEYEETQNTISRCKNQIAEIMKNVKGEMKKLGEVTKYNSYSINPKDEPTKEFIYVDIESVQNGSGDISFDKKIIGNNAPSRARRLAKADSILVSTVRPNLKGFAYLNNEVEDSVYSTGFAIFETANKDQLLPKMIYYSFMYSEDLMNQMIKAMPKGQYPSINASDIDNFLIPVPPLAEQQKIVDQISALEEQIAAAKKIIADVPARKQAILDKWL